MAIYSFNISSVGRSTHAAGTAGAHLSYIARTDAEPVILAEHVPENPAQARTWMNHQEQSDRKNARVIDKLRIALPRELTEKQRYQLMQDFMQSITGGQVPWYGAIHQRGSDQHNPHAHIAVRDRHIETGKRVLRLSDSARDRQKAGLEPKAVEWLRERWEHCANQALEKAGHEARIDRRSLEAQGIDREPNIHIGPCAQHITKTVHPPQSKQIVNAAGRTIDYPLIDAGRTRLERHAEIVDLNLEREARSPHFITRERAKFLKDQIAKDRIAERDVIAHARKRTLEERRLKGRLRSEWEALRQAWQEEKSFVMERLASKWQPMARNLKTRHDFEAGAVKERQGRISARFWRIADLTGRTRRKHASERAELKARQVAERKEFRLKQREERKTQLKAVEARYKPELKALRQQHKQRLGLFEDRMHEGDRQADQRLQDRAAERAREEARFEQTNKQLERMRKDRTKTRQRGIER